MDSPKFEPFQRVRVRVAANMVNLRPGPLPKDHVMGRIGVVEIKGLVYGCGLSTERYLAPAYFIQVKGVGQVLVGEDWLDEAPLSQ